MCAHCGRSVLQSVHLLCGMRVVVAVRLGQSERPKSVECGRVTPTRTPQIDLLNERFQMSNIWLSYDRKRVYQRRWNSSGALDFVVIGLLWFHTTKSAHFWQHKSKAPEEFHLWWYNKRNRPKTEGTWGLFAEQNVTLCDCGQQEWVTPIVNRPFVIKPPLRIESRNKKRKRWLAAAKTEKLKREHTCLKEPASKWQGKTAIEVELNMLAILHKSLSMFRWQISVFDLSFST